jgi:hypothetical protein
MTVYFSIIVGTTVVINSPVIIGHSVVNKLQGKQIFASHILAEFQWNTFQYGTDCHIVIC